MNYPVRAGAGATSPVHSALNTLQEKNRQHPVLTAVELLPARPAVLAPYPDWTHPELRRVYRQKGIEQLYSHQADAAERIAAGKNVVIVTPAASGKTLCYNLPVLDAVLKNPDTRALYLFPTKALEQDQLAELEDLIDKMDAPIRTFTYDGDTPADARKAIRQQGHIVLTNPDMLHAGILPHHTKWTRLFENLRYIVLDELHTYRGVFGSHVANVLRRLKRVARFYGSNPQFICSSATIANPAELAGRLIEEEVELVDRSGAPAGEKFFLFYNPPVVNRFLGIRRPYVNEAAGIAHEFVRRGSQSIVFTNTRLTTEILVTYLKQALERGPVDEKTVRGYRGGYLPSERREIERGLREGSIRAVVATNALELGIDIGSLDTAILAGYPGTIASTWQRAGRAGRRSGTSCAVLVASSNPLDQYIVNHPEYFFGNSPEHGYVNPDNLEILLNHLKCAAFELPIGEKEMFGGQPVEEICDFLAERGFLYPTGGVYHWTQEAYPADTVSLRSVSSDNFVVVDITGEPRVIGEVDFPSALATLHEKAIYIHEGQQHHVEKLDFKERKAYVKQVDTDYFTQAISYTQVKILEEFEREERGPAAKRHGEVLVRRQVVGFKKIKFFTLENVGAGELQLPENEFHTTSCWLTLPRDFYASLGYSVTHRQNGVSGLLNAMQTVAALLLMCDPRDLGRTIEENLPSDEAPGEAGQSMVVGQGQPQWFEPNLHLFDNYPGGIGFSKPLFDMHDELLKKTRELIAGCGCKDGCPSCVGPFGETGEGAKEVALAILDRLCAK